MFIRPTPATVTPSTTNPTQSTTAKFGTKSASFPTGSSCYFDIAADSQRSLTLSGDFTIEGWVYLTDLHFYQCVFELGNNPTSVLYRIRDSSDATGTVAGRGSLLVNGVTIAAYDSGNVGSSIGKDSWAYFCFTANVCIFPLCKHCWRGRMAL